MHFQKLWKSRWHDFAHDKFKWLASAAQIIWQSQSSTHTFLVYYTLHLGKAGFFILDAVARDPWDNSVHAYAVYTDMV